LTIARMALLTTPAPAPYGVFLKWEVLDQLVSDDAEKGRSVDNCVIIAVAAIKADVLKFGLGDRRL
jgi:hypothetical protein